MAKPLRSDDPNPKDLSFSHFGVLDDGQRSKSATAISITLNVLVLLVILILGAVVKTNPALAKKIAMIDLPNKPPPPPPQKPPPPPPKPPPVLPTPPKIQPPRIQPPVVPPPPEIKPMVVPIPKPVVLAPAPPKRISPPPAPVHVSLAHAASIPNHDAHPTAVRMGNTTNPLKSLTGPAVANVNLGSRGVPGMRSSNTGSGARATSVNLGSGRPNSSDMNGRDRGEAVRGVKLGVPGGTGPMNSHNYANAPVNPHFGVTPPPRATEARVQSTAVASPPTVTYKPEPVYTAEAKKMHLEGNVSLRIRVMANGAVEVLGVTHGLGHGLDESAVAATEHTRFKPARDAAGNPVDWTGVVIVRFQMS